LKAFICNRIITAGTVIRFAVSPKEDLPGRPGLETSRRNRAAIRFSNGVTRLSRDFDTNRRRNSRPETDDRFNATDYARRSALPRFDPYRPRYPSGFPPPAPFPRAHPQPPVLRPKSRAINHEDYKASTAGDCSLFWVPGERELRAGRVVQKNETHFMHYSDPLTAVAPYPRIIRVGGGEETGRGPRGCYPLICPPASQKLFTRDDGRRRGAA